MNTETDTIDKHFTLCEAAPDLLAALEKALPFILASQTPDASNYDCLIAARAAIAKAKGDK